MKSKILVWMVGILLGVVVLVIARDHIGLPKAKLTIRVVDERGAPVEGAQVTLTFTNTLTRQGSPVEGLTDGNGLFTAEGSSDSRVGAKVEKPGYYRAGFPFEPFRETNPILNHWQPWNATYTSVLRPIGRPVALYAKRVQAEIPALDVPCGYDLEKGDWVAPYGRGSKSDLIFMANRNFKNRQDFEMKVELAFSNPNDGLMKIECPEPGKYSAFKWSREAPDAGYANSLLLRESAKGDNFNQAIARTDQFFFRVRSLKSNGKIIAANYGKISDGLRLDTRNAKKAAIVRFTYYLNPTPLDRNMEWDTKRNQLPNLSYEETPSDP